MFLADSSCPVSFNPLVVGGSLQFVVGRNIPGNSDMIYVGGSSVRLPSCNGILERLSKVSHDLPSYIPFKKSYRPGNPSPTISHFAGIEVSTKD